LSLLMHAKEEENPKPPMPASHLWQVRFAMVPLQKLIPSACSWHVTLGTVH
jgi:hypothetical protein